ncbi:MAG TPA: hypothetical protein PKA27_16245 [Fimbriimonadaceae bacterium]|nr:hypothetical protein [Fimbriimonadaceae bacterium]
MAEICGDLWQFNLAKVVVVDCTDDYRLMQSPMPSAFYPVIKETWVPAYQLGKRIVETEFEQGFAYDWHEAPDEDEDHWVVGVVAQNLLHDGLSDK